MIWLEPTNLTLALLLLAAAFVMWRSQRSGTFDFGQMLKDESDRASSARVIGFGAFAVSSWALMRYAANTQLTEWMWGFYLAAWSGSVVLSKAIDAWRGKP